MDRSGQPGDTGSGLVATRATAAVFLALGVLGPAGCGGDDDDGGGGGGDDKSSRPAPLVERPTPKRPISAEIGGFTRAIASHSCKDYYPLVHSFVRGRRAGAPATAAECKGGDSALEDLRGDRIDLAGQYGTGGVLEGPTSGHARKYAIWALDGDGRFRYARVSGIGQQAGTPFSHRKEAARIAGRFVGSVRRRDCATMQRLFSPNGSRLVISQGSPRAACRAVLRGKFLAPAVRETPHPRIEVLGGTRNLAFVGVATKRVYFTMMLGEVKKLGLRVVDVVPSTAVKLPKG